MSNGFLDKLKDFFIGSEQEYDDYSEEEMEETDKNVRTRILDFLSGSVFVSGVNSFKISSTAVLYFPSTFVLSRIPGEADKAMGAPRISEPDEVAPEPVLGGSFSDYGARDFR